MDTRDEIGAPDRPHSPVYCWLVVVILVILYTSSFIDRQILSLMVKPIRADLGINDTEYSFLAGLSFALLYSVAGVPIGYVVDRWNRSLLIVVGVTAWSLMTTACGFANTYWRLFGARIGVGIGEATLSPASYSLVSDMFPPHRLSGALSFYTLGIPIGSGLALLIGGPLVEAFARMGTVDLPIMGAAKPWQAVFVAIGLPGLILALLTLLIVREPPRRRSAPTELDRPTFSDVLVYIWRERLVYVPIFLGLTFVALIWYGAAAWYPTYLQRTHGFTVTDAGLFLGFTTLLLGIFGTLAAGWLADWFIYRGRADGHFIVGIIFSLAVMICSGFGPLVEIKWLSIFFIAANAFFAFSWIGVNAALLQIVTPARMRGQISALYLFFANAIGLGFGSTAVAFSTDHIFKRDNAVGESISLVAVISVALGCLIMSVGRKPVARAIRMRAGLIPKFSYA